MPAESIWRKRLRSTFSGKIDAAVRRCSWTSSSCSGVSGRSGCWDMGLWALLFQLSDVVATDDFEVLAVEVEGGLGALVTEGVALIRGDFEFLGPGFGLVGADCGQLAP